MKDANLQRAGISIATTQFDVVLPSQYFAPRGKQAPEQRLMIAVLHNAFESIEKYRYATKHRGRRLFHEAKRWFLADETDWPYSFEHICGVLDLDSDAVRERLRVAPEIMPSSNGSANHMRWRHTTPRTAEPRQDSVEVRVD